MRIKDKIINYIKNTPTNKMKVYDYYLKYIEEGKVVNVSYEDFIYYIKKLNIKYEMINHSYYFLN